ncbi:MAG: UDP-N-acetyl glucosamine 2-epimerase, partial [Asgard group archaeon]|nr:UDP-N-acetyl glucosamine 2-epimerase [Asgard group archaeon]
SMKFTKKILVTLHRPSNVDNAANLQIILDSFEMLSDFHFIFPIHPRTLKNLDKFGLLDRIKSIRNLKVIDPLGYIEFLSILFYVDLVVTDSGGVQEECFCLEKRCLTLRNNTERPETLFAGLNKLVTLNRTDITGTLKQLLESKDDTKPKERLLGDGKSALAILKIIKDYQYEKLVFPTPRMQNWEDYQFHLEEVNSDILLKEFEKKNNQKIQIIFDSKGIPQFIEPDFILRKGFRVVTFGNLN